MKGKGHGDDGEALKTLKKKKRNVANRTQDQEWIRVERMTQPRFELGTFSELTVLD